MSRKIGDIVDDFWLSVDKYLEEKCLALTCNDLYELYTRFLAGGKRYRGQSEGLTGFSEFIVFRIVYHCLEKSGCSFQPERKNAKDNRVYPKFAYEPVFRFIDSRKSVAIGQSISDEELRVKPDISYYKDGKLRSAWEITTFIGKSGGDEKQITDIVSKYESIHEHTPDLKVMYVIYGQTSRKNSEVLGNQAKDNVWFNYTILQGGNGSFEKEVRRQIDLGR